jgi:pimeloyl-ACP methyl ester carboxylesterase
MAAHASASLSPVPCKNLTTLRALKDNLQTVSNPRTGDVMEYLVIGDGAASADDLIVMFNGTGGVLADWPVQMLTNTKDSPRIRSTGMYSPAEDGDISLCHNYHIVLFDYPGVGKSPLAGSPSLDQISNDVDAMLNDAGSRYGIPTSKIDPIGWSLGSLTAIKFAFLSSAAHPDRIIHSLILIATKPGGNTDGFQDGNGSACVTTLFQELKSPSNEAVKIDAEKTLNQLLFPYTGQQQYDGVDSGCTATIGKTSVSLNVKTNCPRSSTCEKNMRDESLNRLTSPWSKTKGVSHELYLLQRELVNDWNLCYCPKASSAFTSLGCSCSGSVAMTSANGGMCQTTSHPVNLPASTNCAAFNFTGQLKIINGPEDLFIQHTYGKALAEGYQQLYGKNRVILSTYDGKDGANHGILIQHPRWTQQQIDASIRGAQ